MHRTTVARRFRRFLNASEAVSALEYAILVGIITVGIGAAVFTFSGNIQNVIAQIGTQVETRDDMIPANPADPGAPPAGGGNDGG